MRLAIQDISHVAGDTTGRAELWIKLLNETRPAIVAEVGVWRGDYAEAILRACPSIETYYMIDPWRQLDQWNKPSNVSNPIFEKYLEETRLRTDFASSKRVELRGTTIEVIDQIPDDSLDFAYIDGDHTLRGITIDLIRVWPKLKADGWIGGDDFNHTIWEHASRFEPTLVYPYAIHFAEAVGARITTLPHNQFLIEKTGRFQLVDLVGGYADTSLLRHIGARRLVMLRGKEILGAVPGVKQAARRVLR